MTEKEIEQDKYAELIISMCTDFLLKKLTWETVVSNLKLIITQIGKL